MIFINIIINLKRRFYEYFILEDNKFEEYEILKDEEIDENCHLKQDSSLIISFHSPVFASGVVKSSVLADNTCPEYVRNGMCYVEGQLDIEKVGEIK